MAITFNKTENKYRIREPLFQLNRIKFKSPRNSLSENLESNLLKTDFSRILNELENTDASILEKLTYIIGDINDINLTVNLDDGLSYDIPGVQIYDDYSYPQYEIGDTGPGGGKIFITPLTTGNTTGKYFEVAPIETQVTRTWSKTRVNLIANPSFGTGTNNWLGQSGATISRNTVSPYSGSGDLLVTSSATDYNLAYHDFITVTPNTPYYLSAYCRNVSGSTRNIYIGVQWFTSAGTYISDNTSAGSGNLTTLAGWVRRSAFGTAPATATKARIILASGTTGLTAGWTTKFDNILFEQSSALGSYFDGSMAGKMWTGTAHASSSQLVGRANLIINPSFEFDVANWNTTSTSCTNTKTAGTIAGGSGSWSMVSSALVTAAYGPSCGGTGVFPITEGTSYTFSAQVLRLVGARTYSARIDWYDSAGVFISLANSSANACTTSTRLSISGTAPVGAARADLRLISTNTGAIGDSHQIDSVFFGETSDGTTYFDGSTSSLYSWTGTIDNSVSIKQRSGADETAIGSGEQNTIDIVTESGSTSATSAAVYCSELTFGDKSDWFLPSLDELNEIYINRAALNSNFTDTYFNSSEVSGTNSWAQNFALGTQSSTIKSTLAYVRPVRAFVIPIKTLQIHTTNKLSGKLARLFYKVSLLENGN